MFRPYFLLHMSSNLIIMCINTSIYLVVKMKFIFQTVLEDFIEGCQIFYRGVSDIL